MGHIASFDRDMSKKTERKMTSADKEAAVRLRRIWDEQQRDHEFTQDDAAEALGVTQGAINQWLNGRIALGLKATFGFARFLKCQPGDIRPDLGALGLASGDLTDEAVQLALHWQENLSPEAQDAVMRLAFSYPPSRGGHDEHEPVAAAS